MKYLLTLFFGTFLLTSCSQDIQDNRAAIQAVKDSILFQGISNSAIINPNGSIAILGRNGPEDLRILVSTLDQTSVSLGEEAGPGDIASYTNPFGTVFTTNSDNGSGEVSLEINGNNTVSGTFNFVAQAANNNDIVTFSRGFIFEVPIANTNTTEETGVSTEVDAFTARVNSIIYFPTEIGAIVSNDILTISASTSVRDISLLMPEDISPDIYDITENGPFIGIYTTPSGESFATEGSLTIESNDTEARWLTGRFVFETEEGDAITDGQFGVNY